MIIITVFLLCLFSSSSYGGEDYNLVSFKGTAINIPAKWNVIEKDNCLFIKGERVKTSGSLKFCREISSNESDYFKINDNGEWEAVSDGIPVLADVNTTSKFTSMSAIVSCKFKDDAGYHTEQCFQAEINLPLNISFIFIGRGDASLFKDYKEVYLSLKVK